LGFAGAERDIAEVVGLSVCLAKADFFVLVFRDMNIAVMIRVVFCERSGGRKIVNPQRVVVGNLLNPLRVKLFLIN
jgi:hypothetical protein